MSILNLFVLIGTILTVSGPSQDGVSDQSEELLRKIDVLQAPIRDLYCEYEGKLIYLRESDRKVMGDPNGEYENYSGRMFIKTPDLYLNTIYHKQLREPGSPERTLRLTTILSTGLETSFYERTPESAGSSATRHVTAADFYETGSYGQIYLVRSFRESLKYDRKMLVYEGTEEIDGRPCERYACVMGEKPYSIETGLVDRFWIDLDRNGHVVRMETHNKGRPMRTVKEIVLERIEGGGTHAWIPVRGTVESWDGREILTRESCQVIPGTPRLNQGIKDEVFAIDSPIGTPLSDQLKTVVHEFGQNRRPPPEILASAEERTQEVIRKAESVKNPPVAASRSRQNSVNWAFWGPFGVCVVAIGLAVSLHIRRGR